MKTLYIVRHGETDWNKMGNTKASQMFHLMKMV